MKFGESLSDGLVPEWKNQYLDYKYGKKLIKKLLSLKFDQKQSTSSLPAGKVSNDKTPLLQPSDMDLVGPIGELEDIAVSESQIASDIRLSHTDARDVPNLRKTSMFSYSLRTPKDKKESYEAETKKFMTWLDGEFQKIDSFYKEKEQEAYERFLFLQDQLYKLREHKTRAIQNKISARNDSDISNKVTNLTRQTKGMFEFLGKFEYPSFPSTLFLSRFKNNQASQEIHLDERDEDEDYDRNYIENRIRNGLSDFDAENDLSSIDSEQQLGENGVTQEETIVERMTANRRDYITKRQKFGVPYLYAKHHLKAATFEYYRSLSLLKSYKILNRTAFRKITKKYDKALGGVISELYMKKVDKESYFQSSDMLDKLTTQMEELFITFFDPETTDRKHSLEKLRNIAYAMNNKEMRQPTYDLPLFSSGTCLGFAVPLFALSLYTALHKILNGVLPEGQFLLQIWAGFFLLNAMILLFGINILVFEYFKINYKFIFEFNVTNALNYKQYFLLPSVGFGFFSFLMWFSFNNFWPSQFPGRDWPWIYFAFIIIIFLWPFDNFYAPSRRWLQVALWRLLFSGFYPVEFRDFFLGDILCSLTYTMGNISFFFCLYAHHWNGVLDESSNSAATMCGSSKSRSMGFFSSLPSIWRFLQCVRRYMDTGDWFPHLANMIKYAITTIYYCLLSVYRINRSHNNRDIFIVFATLNSLYTSAWDIIMDWSLFQSGSKNAFLRDHLFYNRPIYYYFAIISDVILRFQWIFYAFFSSQVQQSAVTSFCIALAEILRRFIWIFFRMENEHCTNVILFRASKATPLPYVIPAKVENAIKRLVYLKYSDVIDSDYVPVGKTSSSRDSAHSTSRSRVDESSHRDDEEADLGLGRFGGKQPPTLNHKSTFMNLGDALKKAHIKDFQRRKAFAPVENMSDDDEDDIDGDYKSK